MTFRATARALYPAGTEGRIFCDTEANSAASALHKLGLKIDKTIDTNWPPDPPDWAGRNELPDAIDITVEVA